ncbi:MAG: hypothetical protein WBJ82_05215 [Tepidanaerobacteraceae bacterium]|nr:hypothetical protein [Tepidanaerobacteraceae bacterium]HQE05146.1 hypothetical protein [Tepidanaerobacteraceae bacterium]
MIVLLISVFVIIALFQMPALIKLKMWRELTAISVLLGIGFVLSLLQLIGVKIPSPNQWIIFLIKSVTNFFG